jgi:hypothetical protein
MRAAASTTATTKALDLDDLRAQVAGRRVMAPVVPGEDLPGDERAQSGDRPRGGKEEDDGEGGEHGYKVPGNEAIGGIFRVTSEAV